MTVDEIKTLIDDLVDTNSTTYPDARKVRAINRSQDQLVNLILENDSMSQFDDANYTDLAEGYLSIVSGQKDYDATEDENGAEILYISKVLAKDTNGIFQELEKIGLNDDKAEASLKEDSDGSPKYYRVSGKSIILAPVPDYASTNGLKIIFQRKPESVTTADTTKELGIPSTFHNLVAVMSAYDYARSKRLDNRNDLLREIEKQETRLGLFISGQDKDVNVVMTPAFEDVL